MNKLIATMAATALAMGVSSAGEVWDEPAPAEVVVQQVAPAPVVEAAACVTIPIYTDPGYDTNDGGVATFSEGYHSFYEEYVFAGGLDARQFQGSIIGSYLNYAFDQGHLTSFEMDLTSIDVTGLDEITVCR